MEEDGRRQDFQSDLEVELRILKEVQKVHLRANKNFSPPPVHRLEAMMYGLKDFVYELMQKRIAFASKGVRLSSSWKEIEEKLDTVSRIESQILKSIPQILEAVHEIQHEAEYRPADQLQTKKDQLEAEFGQLRKKIDELNKLRVETQRIWPFGWHLDWSWRITLPMLEKSLFA